MSSWKEHAWLLLLGCIVVNLGWSAWHEWNNLAAIARVPAFLFGLLVFSFALSSYFKQLRSARTTNHKG
jgi:MFS superfamily sulfate permease-like transporter